MLSTENIEDLRDVCKKNDVFWISPGGAFHEILSVSDGPVDIDGDGMPIPVGYLTRGHIDLESVEPESLVVVQRLFVRKPPQEQREGE